MIGKSTDLRRYPGGNGENYKVPEGQPDYHPNDPTDLDNYINLLSALRTAFDQYGYILSATLPSRPADIDIGYPADKLQLMDPSVDFWNLMSYDHLNRRDNVTDFQAGGEVVVASGEVVVARRQQPRHFRVPRHRLVQDQHWFPDVHIVLPACPRCVHRVQPHRLPHDHRS